jgi:predicted permease
MSILRILRDRLRALRHPERVRDEIADELRFHVDMRARDNERAGMNPVDARHDAERRFGSRARIGDTAYDVRGGGGLETLWQDIRYGARMLSKQAVFSATVILTVGIGVGANATIFTLVDRLLLRTLPVERASELEQVTLPNDWSSFSTPFVRELRRRTDVFSGVLARATVPATIENGGDARRGVVELVSGNYFSVLGTHAAHGRLLNDEDDRLSVDAPVAVVSHRYWRDRLSSDPAVIGKMIQIDNHPFTVIGVAAPEFLGVDVGATPEAWVPLSMQPQLLFQGSILADNAEANWLRVIGRRAPGVTQARAQSGATLVFQQFQNALSRPRPDDWPTTVRLIGASRGLPGLRDQYESSLRLLMSVVAMVMLIACASITTLLMTRSTARRQEIAVRLTLGATRARLVRQLLTEGAMLSLCGGAAGVAIAQWGLHALLRLLPADRVPLSIDAGLDARSLAFSLALSIITALLFSAGPALRFTRPDVVSAIKTGSDSATTARATHFNVRKFLVGAQVALSLVLVIGASLFIRSLARTAAIPLGFETANVVIASVDPSLSGYSPAKVEQFYRELETRLATVAGVRAVGFSAWPLLGGELSMITVRLPGVRPPSDRQAWLLSSQVVGGDFFGAAGIRIRRGRGFAGADSLAGARVVVLNEAAARNYFGDDDAIGRTLLLGRSSVTVIGVASDSKYTEVREENRRIVYAPFGPNGQILVGSAGERTIYVRTSGDAAGFASTIASVVRTIDKTVPVYNVKTFAEQKAESLARERLVAALSAWSGGVALVLAAIALYGLVSFGAASRTREIGIRVSLGADARRVIWLIVRSAIAMVVGGCAAGVALGLALSRFVQSHLYGISATDLSTMATAIAILLGTAFVAALVPAVRAARVDPTVALRYE